MALTQTALEPAMTVVGIHKFEAMDTQVFRTRATHYAIAVDRFIDEHADHFREEVADEQGLDEDEPLVDDLAGERALEEFREIRVYLGHPPAPDFDDVSGLELIHTE